MDVKQKITSRPGLFGSTVHYDQKGHKIGSSQQGLFSTTHYDAKGHKVGSSWNSPMRSDHYDAKGRRVGKTTKGGFGRKDSWFED